MKFFIDTADLDDIREAMSWGALSGVTTNPSLYAKTGGKLADFEQHMVKICEICEDLPVSAESTATTTQGMVEEGRRLAGLAPNIVVKLPIGAESLAATKTLAEEGVAVNMTLVFSAPQALLAARAGARYISPFVGRVDESRALRRSFAASTTTTSATNVKSSRLPYAARTTSRPRRSWARTSPRCPSAP